MRINELIPVFVENIPEEKEEGKLYISKKHAVAIHLCACGCGIQSVTSLIDLGLWTDGWKMTENEGKITLRPSIGNFDGENPYHAHYYITNNEIEWL